MQGDTWDYYDAEDQVCDLENAKVRFLLKADDGIMHVSTLRKLEAILASQANIRPSEYNDDGIDQ